MGTLLETFDALFVEKEPRPSINTATPPIAVLDQLAALSGALDMQEESLSFLREERAMLRDENDLLWKKIDGLQRQYGVVAADMYA